MSEDVSLGNREAGSFCEVVAKECPEILRVAEHLDTLARQMLSPIRTHPYERGLKYLACSVSSGHSALLLLARNGHGAEAMAVGRGMFETYCTYRYLILKPDEFVNFIDYDPVARWKRLELYKVHAPEMYKTLPVEHIEFVAKEFNRVRGRFTTKRGKPLDRWTRMSLFEIARAVGEEQMYEIAYRHASSLSHSDPMGLTTLIDGKTFEIELGPSLAHVSIALATASHVMFRTLSQYNHLLNVGFSESLSEIESALAKRPVSHGGNPVGWLEQVLKGPSDDSEEKG